MNEEMFSEQRISLDVVVGGFILTYPKRVTVAGEEKMIMTREVFSSPRKLNQKLKDVIEDLSLVSEPK